jgi:protein TonB
VPQPTPEAAAKTPLETLQPVADSPTEAVLPYQSPVLEGTASTETTSQLAAAPAVSTEQPAASGELVEQQKTRYLLEQFAYIREAIIKRTNYPYLARKNGWTGTVVVRFMIEEDGRVSEVWVDKSSGVPLLDQAATETVKSTAPFPKPPARAEIIVPISYRLG